MGYVTYTDKDEIYKKVTKASLTGYISDKYTILKKALVDEYDLIIEQHIIKTINELSGGEKFINQVNKLQELRTSSEFSQLVDYIPNYILSDIVGEKLSMPSIAHKIFKHCIEYSLAIPSVDEYVRIKNSLNSKIDELGAKIQILHNIVHNAKSGKDAYKKLVSVGLNIKYIKLEIKEKKEKEIKSEYTKTYFVDEAFNTISNKELDVMKENFEIRITKYSPSEGNIFRNLKIQDYFKEYCIIARSNITDKKYKVRYQIATVFIELLENSLDFKYDDIKLLNKKVSNELYKVIDFSASNGIFTFNNSFHLLSTINSYLISTLEAHLRHTNRDIFLKLRNYASNHNSTKLINLIDRYNDLEHMISNIEYLRKLISSKKSIDVINNILAKEDINMSHYESLVKQENFYLIDQKLINNISNLLKGGF